MEFINEKVVSTNQVSKKPFLKFPVIALAILISSYYYVLPLGRYAVAGIDTDFRIYDFIFIGFLALFGVSYLPNLQKLFHDQRLFFRYSVFLMWFIGIATCITYLYSGQSAFLTAAIRALRFVAYLLTAGYIIVLVNNRQTYNFILIVIFANIVIQTVLAFAQAQGWIANPWPDYWLDRFGDWPVGTLSPHHKQIGVVMLLGIGLCLSLVRYTRQIPFKIGYIALATMMVSITVYVGIRTAWLGLVVIVIAYGFTYGLKSLPAFAAVVAIIAMVAFSIDAGYTNPLSEQLNDRLLEPFEDEGVAGVVGMRAIIYFDWIPQAIQTSPLVLIFGTGFQNISSIISATGAHNNYLQAIIELGFFGFLVYAKFLITIWQNLRATMSLYKSGIEYHVAAATFIAFVAILATMFVGETLWAQYSMFTLTGQIMTVVALAVSPLLWKDGVGDDSSFSVQN